VAPVITDSLHSSIAGLSDRRPWVSCTLLLFIVNGRVLIRGKCGCGVGPLGCEAFGGVLEPHGQWIVFEACVRPHLEFLPWAGEAKLRRR